MKKTVLFVLLDDFADWEGAFLSTALNNGITQAAAGTDYTARSLSITRDPIRSMGGMTLIPDYSIATIPEEYAALILIGGLQWQSEKAQQLLPIIQKSLKQGILVGAICNASLFLGKHGVLNDVHHTSNTLELLEHWGREHYTGARLYLQQQAVRDGNIITANGSGCLEFTRECLLWLEAGTTEQIEEYYRFNKHGFYGN